MKSTHSHIRFNDLVVFEDGDLCIINKPPYISTLADRTDPTNILDLAKSVHQQAMVCHRLDKETSGLLVLAKNAEAHRNFSMQLQNREVTKIYHALVEGRHELEEVEINTPLHTGSSKTRVDLRKGKPSVTLVTTLDIYKKHTLLACMPFTGRMHQIRVHLSSIDLPICGDDLYGGRPIFLSEVKKKFNLSKGQEEQPLLPRLALHAAKLEFKLTNGQLKRVEAPYPKDLAATFSQLEKNRS